MNSIIKFILFATLASVIVCDWHKGGCPTIKRPQEAKFDLNQYLGKWYSIATSKSFGAKKGECSTADYSIRDDGSIRVFNAELLADGTINSVDATAYQNPSDSFKLGIKFSKFQPDWLLADYEIVETDYTNYALIYCCTNLFLARKETVFILSRTPVMEEKSLERLFKKLDSDFDLKRETIGFEDQSQERCHRSG